MSLLTKEEFLKLIHKNLLTEPATKLEGIRNLLTIILL